MIRTITILLLIFLADNTMAQRYCGTEDAYQLKLKYPQRYDSIEKKIRAFTAQKKLEPQTLGAIRSIPVVVHVLYINGTTDVTNISDEKIFSQINVLNQDFRKLNTDWTNTPSVWQSLVADCEVRFCLASKDVNGNPTSGIERIKTDSINFSVKKNPKHSNTGGADAWASDKYLNIWVVPRINSGGTELLGYATFPQQLASAPTEDGLVIRYNAFGTVAPVQTSYNLGRTATHEIGHWFGLKHIWGDESACAADDDVGDTPLQADKNFGCKTYPLLDACQTSGNGVMFMNYMDYVNDNCMYMFTAGQKAVIDYYLANDRKSVADNASSGCGDCPNILTLSGTLSTNIIYRSATQINSTQTIQSGVTSQYKTGDQVILSPGFNATSGSDVNIKTNEICYPPN